jgi:hypothetical protein
VTGPAEASGVVLVSVAGVGWLSQSDDAVLWLAAIIGGLAIIWSAGRRLWGVARKAVHALDDMTGEEARPGVAARPGWGARLGALEDGQQRQLERTEEALQVGWANTEQLQVLSTAVRELQAASRMMQRYVREHDELGAEVMRVGVANDERLHQVLREYGIPVPDQLPYPEPPLHPEDDSHS